MVQSIAATHQPATDLGFLLHQHLDRLQPVELAFGKGWVFYPQASAARCASTYGYQSAFSGIGAAHAALGAPTQMVVCTR